MNGKWKPVIVGVAVALATVSWSGSATAQAPATYDQAKDVYGDMNKASDALDDAKKDCAKAGKGATSGVVAWKKSRDLGINKDGWWKKSKLNALQEKEMELLYKTAYPKFQKAMLEGGKSCYNDPRFQKALDDFKGGDKKD